MKVTIYHNPRCSKSRNTLALLRKNGVEPEIVEYLKGALNATNLTALAGKLDNPLANAIRTNEAPYRDLDLSNRELSEAELVDLIVEYPILLNRPIVETPQKATLCRPEERVLDLIQTSRPDQNDTEAQAGSPDAKA